VEERLIQALEAHTAALQAQTRSLEYFAHAVMSLAAALAENEGLDDAVPGTYLDGSPR